MHKTAEFMLLLDTVRLARQCAGENCPRVPTDAFQTAERVDSMREAHKSTASRDTHEPLMCSDCQAIQGEVDRLERQLQAANIILPAGSV